MEMLNRDAEPRGALAYVDGFSATAIASARPVMAALGDSPNVQTDVHPSLHFVRFGS